MIKKNARYVVPLKRKLKGKTDYKARLTYLKSESPRLAIRRTLKHITAQIIAYNPKGDKILASATTQELHKYGWKAGTGNTPAAYLCGILIAEKAKKAKINNAILDIGMRESIKGNRIYATAKGAIDNDFKIPFDEKMAPSKERITGKHISEYCKKINTQNKPQFSKFEKNKNIIENIEEHFNEVKNNIIKPIKEKETSATTKQAK